MKIKKILSKKWKISFIDIDGIEIDYTKVIKILNQFNFQEVIVVIDGIQSNNEIFKELIESKIKHTTNMNKKNKLYLETIIELPKENLNILSKILLFQPNLYFIETKGNVNFEQELNNLNNNKYSKLLEEGIIDFTIEFWSIEKSARISFNTKKYDQDIIKDKLQQQL